jgi:hypothetical protein
MNDLETVKKENRYALIYKKIKLWNLKQYYQQY